MATTRRWVSFLSISFFLVFLHASFLLGDDVVSLSADFRHRLRQHQARVAEAAKELGPHAALDKFMSLIVMPQRDLPIATSVRTETDKYDLFDVYVRKFFLKYSPEVLREVFNPKSSLYEAYASDLLEEIRKKTTPDRYELALEQFAHLYAYTTAGRKARQELIARALERERWNVAVRHAHALHDDTRVMGKDWIDFRAWAKLALLYSISSSPAALEDALSSIPGTREISLGGKNFTHERYSEILREHMLRKSLAPFSESIGLMSAVGFQSRNRIGSLSIDRRYDGSQTIRGGDFILNVEVNSPDLQRVPDNEKYLSVMTDRYAVLPDPSVPQQSIYFGIDEKGQKISQYKVGDAGVEEDPYFEADHETKFLKIYPYPKSADSLLLLSQHSAGQMFMVQKLRVGGSGPILETLAVLGQKIESITLTRVFRDGGFALLANYSRLLMWFDKKGQLLNQHRHSDGYTVLKIPKRQQVGDEDIFVSTEEKLLQFDSSGNIVMEREHPCWTLAKIEADRSPESEDDNRTPKERTRNRFFRQFRLLGIFGNGNALVATIEGTYRWLLLDSRNQLLKQLDAVLESSFQSSPVDVDLMPDGVMRVVWERQVIRIDDSGRILQTVRPQVESSPKTNPDQAPYSSLKMSESRKALVFWEKPEGSSEYKIRWYDTTGKLDLEMPNLRISVKEEDLRKYQEQEVIDQFSFFNRPKFSVDTAGYVLNDVQDDIATILLEPNPYKTRTNDHLRLPKKIIWKEGGLHPTADLNVFDAFQYGNYVVVVPESRDQILWYTKKGLLVDRVYVGDLLAVDDTETGLQNLWIPAANGHLVLVYMPERSPRQMALMLAPPSLRVDAKAVMPEGL